MLKLKKFGKVLIENWPAKILSLAIAVFLFYFYKINSTEIRYISVPLEIYLHSDFIASDAYPNEARVTLRGSPGAVSLVQENDIIAYADFTERDEKGVYREPVRIRRLGSALYADPLEIRVSPDMIELAIDKKLVKTIEVTPVITGYPAENNDFTGYTVVPEKLTIEGPFDVVKNIDTIKTERISLSGRQSSFTIPVKIDLNEPLVSFPEGDEVQFRGNIERSLIIKSIAPLEIELVNTDEELSYELEINSGSIRVETDRAEAEKIDRENTSLYVDVGDITRPGVYNMPVFVSIPENAEIMSISPETVRVYVSASGRL